MYTLGSTEFNQIIETPNNQSVKKRLVLLDNGTIIDKIKSLTLYSSSSSQELQLGTTNMAYIEAEVDSDLLLTNREARLECGVELSDGSEEYIPMGVFTIQKPQGDIDFVKFKAHDNMQKFEKMYVSALDYPTTSDLVLDEICNMCGVVLSTPIENPIEITEKLQGYTCREVLGFIAGIHGKFACIDRLGTLNLRWYSETPIDKQIGLIWAFNKSDDDFTVDKIEIAKDTETNYTSGSGFSAIYHSNPLATQEITDDLFAKLDGFTYNASTIDMLDDIRLDVWDVVKVTYLDGKEYLIPCMSLKQDFGQGSTSIQSYAKSDTENEYRYTGSTTNYINRVAMELLLTNRIVATKVDAEYVNSHAITTENFEAKVAEIKDLVVEEIDGLYADIRLANIDVANIDKTNIGLLLAEVGLIDQATIVDGHITGFLDAVEINANKITAGTLMVDRLIFRGSEESIIYQLNNITSKNLLIYPYQETTHTESGITWTDLGDGTVKANGTATANSDYILFNLDKTVFEVGTYTISGMPEDSTSTTYFIYLNWYKDGAFNKVTSFAKETTFTLTEEDINTYTFRLALRVLNGKTANNVIFKPMLSKGSEVLPYEPYRERTQALTSETVNGEVLTDRTISADKIIAKSITTNELDVDKIFGNEAVLNKIVSQEIFSNAVATNTVVVGKANRDEVVADNLLEFPYYEAKHTQSNIEWTVLDDGTVKANGTANALSQFYFNLDTTLNLKPNTTYTLSGCPSGGSSSTYALRIIINYRLDGQVQYRDIGNGVTFTTPSNYQHCRIMADASDGIAFDNLIFKPMLEKGSVAHPYTEYSKGGTGLANNIYYQGTTLIDGGNIYTGTVTADKIDVDDLFAGNINMTGKFTSQGKAQLAPGIDEFNMIKLAAFGEITLTDEQKLLYDLDKSGSVNLVDSVIVKNIILGRRTIDSLETDFGYTIPQSDIQIVINSSNPQKVISISATNSWGRQIEAYFGLDGLSVPKVETNNIKAFGIEVEEEIMCVGDVYANYGLDTQVSLLGLQDKMSYLQPHPYSLATDLVLTTTQTTYNVVTDRKFSDYGMLILTMGSSQNDVRATSIIPRTIFDGSDTIGRTFYLDCWSNNGQTFNQIAVEFISDTQFRAWLTTSTTVVKQLNIYGVKTDATLSVRGGTTL